MPVFKPIVPNTKFGEWTVLCIAEKRKRHNNAGLGLFGDSIEKLENAITYLKRYV